MERFYELDNYINIKTELIENIKIELIEINLNKLPTISFNEISEIKYFMKVDNKYFKCDGGSDIIKLFINFLPVYKEHLKYIEEYSTTEINKIRKHLQEKFKGFDYNGLISSYLDADYWY